MDWGEWGLMLKARTGDVGGKLSQRGSKRVTLGGRTGKFFFKSGQQDQFWFAFFTGKPQGQALILLV